MYQSLKTYASPLVLVMLLAMLMTAAPIPTPTLAPNVPNATSAINTSYAATPGDAAPGAEAAAVMEKTTGNLDPSDFDQVTPFEAINFTVNRHFNAYSAAVIGFLNMTVELPAKVEIAVPQGSEILWFSEISGGPVANDPEFRDQQPTRTENGQDIYTVVLEHFPIVQIEYRINHDPNTRLGDGQYSIAMEYTPATDTPFLRLMTNLPEESIVTDPEVEFMGQDSEGYLVFFRLFGDVSAFQTVQGEITYTPPAGTGMIAEGGNLLGGLWVTIAVSLAGVALAATYLILKARNQKEETQAEE